MEIVRASGRDHERLTEIAHASKRHWNYPEHWIEIWRRDLTLTPEFITGHPVFTARIDDQLAGFYALATEKDDPSAWTLEHMWVDPRYIGHGVGAALYRHMISEARRGGAVTVEILSDPNARGFYEHMGAEYVGDHIGDPLDGRPRVLPIYQARL